MQLTLKPAMKVDWKLMYFTVSNKVQIRLSNNIKILV